MSENQTEVVKFLNFLSNPNDLIVSDLGEIKDWVSKYPYSQSLKFIAAKAAEKGNDYQNLLAQAATIAPSRKTLHQLIHQPENFRTTVLPFSIDDVQTIEERQIAVSIEENLGGVEDNSKLTFGINLNEIYGSENDSEKKDQVSEVENIEEETQKEQVLSIAVAQHEEEVQEAELEDIKEELHPKEEEVLAIADETQTEEFQETEVENIEEETQAEEVQEAEVDNIEEEIQIEENAFAFANEEQVNVIQDLEVENIEEETQAEEVQEAEVENFEEETQIEEVLVIADEEQLEEVQEAEIENNEEETQVEEVQETEVENIEKDAQTEEESLTIADEEQLEEVQEAEIENNEEESQVERECLAIADEEQLEKVQESEVESIEEESVKEEKPTQKEELAFQYAPQTDFFALNRKDKVEEKRAEEVLEKATNTEESVAAYNDERMPYTFLWWLNKTRNEHANTQPYSSFKLDTSRQIKKQETDGLNHQIAENIFHLRGVEELSSSGKNYTVPFDFRKKEFQIIEKFIKEEPQIRPPAANKIDSENKAKNSSVDNNQVVSETLAKIYVEQMLYHKALDVYKKLSLKYPEKSTYFASQIKYLELKVN